MASFKTFNLSDLMVKSLNRQGYFKPSNVQQNVIPKALKGLNLVVQSETGSGKTHSFLIPTIEQIDQNDQNVQVIIMAPTRELARQIYEFAMKFDEFNKIKIRLFTSESEKSQNTSGLSSPPQIVIGTPGRIKDILVSEKVLRLDKVKKVILDEADMLLTLGYFDDIDEIIYNIKNVQLLVFSATIEEKLKFQLHKYIKADLSIIIENNRTSKNVTHNLIDLKHRDAYASLKETLTILNPYFVIVFASKKETVNKIYSFLKENAFNATILTGDLSQRERKSTLKMIKNNRYQIIVASDLAARGLDLEDVTVVINFDLPNELEYYYHRAGRTGRFDKTGECYTFYNTDKVTKVQQLINQGLQFNFLTIRDGEIVTSKGLKEVRRSKKVDEELRHKIRSVASKNSSKEGVKPGYKKKKKQAIDKVKRQHKREIIKKEIRKQRVERYKTEAKKYE